MTILVQRKIAFWARVVSKSPPHRILQIPDAKKHVLKIIGASKQVFQGLFDLKKGHYVSKNWPKIVNIFKKICMFQAWGLPSRPPHPILGVPNSPK